MKTHLDAQSCALSKAPVKSQTSIVLGVTNPSRIPLLPSDYKKVFFYAPQG